MSAITAEDAALRLDYADKTIMVPGYGLAAAQAQHQARDLANLIEKRGGDLRFAIHPVAGRMPGDQARSRHGGSEGRPSRRDCSTARRSAGSTLLA